MAWRGSCIIDGRTVPTVEPETGFTQKELTAADPRKTNHDYFTKVKREFK